MGTVAVCLCLSLWGVATAATWYVDDSVIASGTGDSWQTAFKMIQQGINAASHGDTVIVAEGTYVENIHFNGKNIILRSTDPLDPAVVANTIIDGNQSGSVVTFSGTEDETCVLSGLRIENGRAQYGGGILGGDFDSCAEAAIRNNVICGNWAGYFGGGLAHCDGLITNNVVYGSSASMDGGALYDCDGPILNNTIADNSGSELISCRGEIRNCIIWGSQARPQLEFCRDPTYCCIRRWRGGGEGNISQEPHFVNATDRDYHLESWSPCIDAGDPTSPFSEEPEPNGGRINMGAYGNTPEATSGSPDADCDGLPDDWEQAFFGDLAQGARDDPDSDLICNIEELHRGLTPTSPPASWYVDAALSASGDGTSPRTAFRTIQEGINAASDSDTVIVARGIYVESIRFDGKNIVLRSTDPLDPNAVANTVIDAGGGGSGVAFSGTEDAYCILSGFTIRNGGGSSCGWGQHGGGICGGYWEMRTHASIDHNVITENRAGDSGGGLAYCDGIIDGNTIIGNEAYNGGGISACGGVIQNNTIVWNRAEYGGGLCGWDGNLAGKELYGATIRNNIIAGNSAELSGGGLSDYDGVIENNLICDNYSAYRGGGLAYCGPVIQNNTVSGNIAFRDGGGLYQCGSIIRNCIIWGNEGRQTGSQLHKSGIPIHSCIQDWTAGGGDNIATDPLFIDADGPDDKPWTYQDNDYHLQPDSPCINAGANYYWFAWPQRDLDGNCRLAGGRVDMGCYEYASSPDFDGDLLSDLDELRQGPNAFKEDADGDGLRDGLEILRGTDPLEKTLPGTLQVPSEVSSIQKAVCLAVGGDQIVVSPGTYRENLHFCGLDIVLRSEDPEDPELVASTIVDGGGLAPVVTFTGTESHACLVSGLTITRGSAKNGGGVFSAAYQARRTHATIQTNIIMMNFAGVGGGLAHCDGTIQRNTITRNSAEIWGGGLAFCGGNINDNIISDNSAGEWGGGLSHCTGLVGSNTIIGNTARTGGGLKLCSGVIVGNIITGNVSEQGGGALGSCYATVQNNTIWRNFAGNVGGGLLYCEGPIQNCIIWGNVPDQVYRSEELTHSCVQQWTGGGEGNIAEDPRFVDAENGDFRLRPDSPCIDAGFNDPELPETDIAGMHRIMYGGKSLTADMGAYEFTINKVELVPGTDEALFTWSSLADKSYSILYSSDLFNWQTAVENFPSLGTQTTSWTDDGSLTGLAPNLVWRRFYRILENP